MQSQGSLRLAALSKSLNAGALSKIEAAIDDESLIDDFKPHMLHKAHELFRERTSPFSLRRALANTCSLMTAIALVNRKPHGAPGHQDFRVPQDAAWLAALRHAERDVFM